MQGLFHGVPVGQGDHHHGLGLLPCDNDRLTVFDHAHSEFEERWFTLGMASDGKLLAVSHTYTATGLASARVRMISVREATRNERRQYEDEPR